LTISDEAETVIHSNDAFAIVAYSKIKNAHIEDKPAIDIKAALEKLKFPLAPSLLDSAQYQKAYESSLHPTLQLASVSEPTQLFVENVVEKGPFVAISGISFPGPFESLEKEVAAIMDKIQDILKSKGLQWENVLMMHLFVRDMGSFAAINKVYGSYFSLKPPSR
jgi:diphthine-ammonia ligase